jgi:hypothetical protein
MRDVTQDEECGTCILGDMTFESYTYQDFPLDVLERASKRFLDQVYSTQARVNKYMKVLIDDVRENQQAMEEAIQKSIAKYKKRRTTEQGAPSTLRHETIKDDRTRGEPKKEPTTEKKGELHPPLPSKDPNPSVQQESDVSLGDEITDKADLVTTEHEAEDNDRSPSIKTEGGNMGPRQGVVDEDRFRYLSRKVEVLSNEVLRMSNAPPPWTQGKGTSKRSVPADERSRCGLLYLPNEVIEISSDDEANLFKKEPAAPPKAKKTKRVSVSKTMGCESPDEDGTTPRDTLRAALGRITKKRDGALRNWQESKVRNCNPDKIYRDILEATAENMIEVFHKMRKLGYAVITDFNKLRDTNKRDTYSLFQDKNIPTLSQATFYKTANQTSGASKPPMETIFEGIRVNHGHNAILPVKPTVPRKGTELRSVMTYNTKQYKAYQKLCKGQADDIIRGIFHNHTKKNGTNTAAEPTFWHTEHNIVVGGQDHQHPHCDQGKIGSFANESVFPFVVTHGFGINEFQMWLLPNKHKRDYGFLYQFPKTAILFMRGDFMHAGPCKQEARSHSLYFPLTEAGWDAEYPYWGADSIEAWMKDPAVYLHNDYGCPPFAWPKFSKRTPSGDETITYPADLTLDLIPAKKRTKPKRKRALPQNATEKMKEEKGSGDSSFEEEFQARVHKRLAIEREPCEG